MFGYYRWQLGKWFLFYYSSHPFLSCGSIVRWLLPMVDPTIMKLCIHRKDVCEIYKSRFNSHEMYKIIFIWEQIYLGNDLSPIFIANLWQFLFALDQYGGFIYSTQHLIEWAITTNEWYKYALYVKIKTCNRARAICIIHDVHIPFLSFAIILINIVWIKKIIRKF